MYMKDRLRLFALSVYERKLMLRFINTGNLSAFTLEELGALQRTFRYVKRGGFAVYAGSVTDQDGDSTWHLSSSFTAAQGWADYMAHVSFQKPRIYTVEVTRSGFGPEKQFDYEPDKMKPGPFD